MSRQLLETMCEALEVVGVWELDSISTWEEESEFELKSGSIDFELGKY
jgi:hypothetical protein